MKTAVMAVIFLISINGFANVPSVTCTVHSPEGTEILQTRPLYPIRSSSLYRVHEDFFIELRYHAVGSFVRVYQLRMPHSPWTFGESMLEEIDLKLSGIEREGQTQIDHVLEGAVLSCKSTSR